MEEAEICVNLKSHRNSPAIDTNTHMCTLYSEICMGIINEFSHDVHAAVAISGPFFSTRVCCCCFFDIISTSTPCSVEKCVKSKHVQWKQLRRNTSKQKEHNFFGISCVGVASTVHFIYTRAWEHIYYVFGYEEFIPFTKMHPRKYNNSDNSWTTLTKKKKNQLELHVEVFCWNRSL